MKILIADCSPGTRDQVHVAFDAFSTFEVDVSDGFDAYEMTRRVDYDAVVVAVGSSLDSSGKLLERLGEQGADTPLIVVAREETIFQLKREKVRSNIYAFVKDPIDPVDLFRTVSRLKRRDAQPAI